ncbi:MAG TPA: serine hydrolase domain-containing protein [Vicinamibacterales bacterium]
MRFLRERRPASPKRDQREGGLPSRPARGILPVLLLVVVLAAPDSVATDRWDSIRAQIRQTMAGANLPSISVAVAHGGKIIWEESFGWADRDKKIAATPQTMYSLASISKPITATGLMALVERGAIDLDKPANDYLGTGKLTGLAGDATGATVRRVLSHTAGLPLHYQFYYSTNDYRPTSNDETIARYGILVNPPGDVYEYSNLGFGILDHLTARVSGMDYADYLRTQVFIPLGMTRTSVGIAPGLEPYAAQRYDSRQQPIPFYDFDHRGGSAVYSSARDLVRFGMFHLKDHLSDQGAILTDETIDLMHQPVAPAPYGLGWGVTADDNGYLRYSHTGGMPGVATVLNLYPAEHLAVVVLTNASGGNIGRIANEIAATVLPKYAETRQQRTSQPASPPGPVAAFKPTAELVGEWSGTIRTWEGEVPLTLTVPPDGNVHVQMGAEHRTQLNQVSWRGNNLRGRFSGTMPTSDARRWPHSVLLNLRLRAGTLSGMATAQTTAEPIFFALTSFASLKKAGP